MPRAVRSLAHFVVEAIRLRTDRRRNRLRSDPATLELAGPRRTLRRFQTNSQRSLQPALRDWNAPPFCLTSNASSRAGEHQMWQVAVSAQQFYRAYRGAPISLGPAAAREYHTSERKTALTSESTFLKCQSTTLSNLRVRRRLRALAS